MNGVISECYFTQISSFDFFQHAINTGWVGGWGEGGWVVTSRTPARPAALSVGRQDRAYVSCEGDLGVHVEDGRVVHPGPARRLPHHAARARQAVIKRINKPSNCARATTLRAAVFYKRI